MKPKNDIPTKLDLINKTDIKDMINKIKPDRIIHLAAMTNVDLYKTVDVFKGGYFINYFCQSKLLLR